MNRLGDPAPAVGTSATENPPSMPRQEAESSCMAWLVGF